MADPSQIQEKLKAAMMNIVGLVLTEAKNNLPSGVSPIMRENILRTQFKHDKGSSINFGFTHADADVLEKGQSPIPFSGTYTQRVPQHTRKTKRGNVSVRKHTRKYKNHRPMNINNRWFMATQTPDRKPTKWLETIAERMFEDETLLAKQIKLELER